MPRRFEWIALLAILSLAGWLRLGRPEVTEFKRDEAALYSLALDVAEFKTLHLRGIGSSVGLPNAPMSVYLFALPLFVWKSPLAATLFVGVLNTFSVALAYVMVRRYWGVRAALIAALLYAVAPWAVVYSRKIWAQNLLPLFVTGYIFAALLAFAEGRRRWLIVHLALLAVIIQIHLSGLSLIPLTVLLLILFRRAVDWRMVGWGMLVAALLFAPFALYAVGAMGSGSSNLGALLGRRVEFSTDSLSYAALLTMGTELHSLAGPQAFRDFLASVPDFTLLLNLIGVLALGGLAVVVWQRFRRESRSDAGLILAVWLVLPIVFFIPHTTPIFPHYFIVLVPAPFVLAGVFVDWALHRVESWIVRGAVAAVVMMGAAQVSLTLALLNFVAARATPGGFGMPLGQSLAVAGAVRGAPDVIVAAEGSDPRFDEVPAVFAALLRETPHRFADARTTAVLPADPEARVVLWPSTDSFVTESVYLTWGEPQQSVSSRAGEGAILILAPRTEALGVPRPREASALLSNGAELLGSGGTARAWQLWWQATESASDENFTLFAHALNADGERVAQADVPTYPVNGWRAGDRVVSFFSLDVAGAIIRAGMYGSVSLAPVEVLDANGNPAGQWIDFDVNDR